MVDGLSPGTFFNIVVFERQVDVYLPELRVATQDNKAGVRKWIEPYWKLEGSKIQQRGTFRKNYEPKMVDWPSDGGSSRLDLALTTAFEMRADLIFIITDGTPSVQEGWTAADQAAFDREKASYTAERARYEASAKGRQEIAAYEKKREAWQKARSAANAERAKRGLPPEVKEGGNYGAPSMPGPHPPYRKTGRYSGDEIVANLRRLAALNYGSDNREWPTVNVVGYSADDGGQAFIRKLDAGFPNSSWRNIVRPSTP